MNVRLASRNDHKRRELQRLLPQWTIELLEAEDYPPEDGDTYYDNARAKAEFARAVGPPEEWMLGEDSGIEIAGLGGAPGVRSSRTAAGDEVGWTLRALVDVEGDGRHARYVCELVALAPDGRELRGAGTLSGRIATERSGSEGFGFDPVFIPDGEAETVAALGDEWKAHHSHRAHAARALLEQVQS
jgi:XTP/dITP diphosphohydrolase